MGNIITATFTEGYTRAVTESRFQYDYGQILMIDGLVLPEAYEVQFSNSEKGGTAKTQIGGADGVTVPDEYFLSGQDIYAFLVGHTGEEDGETEKVVLIPVKDRSTPTHETPTPVEQSEITQAIVALQAAVEHTAADVEQAGEYAEAAGMSASDANAYAQAASASADQAQDSADAASASAGRAAASAQAADASAGTAEECALSAHLSEQNAQDAADRAEQSAAQSGYLWFWIGDDGHLYMDRTPNTQVDFYLGPDGHLYVED